MGIYIKGMNMPKHGFKRFDIYPNGILEYKNEADEMIKVPNAVISVKTPHGQLIDKDEFAKVIVINGVDVEFINKATGLLMNAQPIIETETE